MKTSIIVAFFLCLTGIAQSQSMYDSIRLTSVNLEDSIGDRLAELAIKNNRLAVNDLEVTARKYEVGKARSAWLNNFTATYNVNEFNLRANQLDEQNVFFPRYNFGVTIPLSYPFSKSSDVKIAKARYEQAKVEKDLEIAQIKQLIKSRYQDYKSQSVLLSIQDKNIEDELVLFESAEDKFKRGEITLVSFTEASKRYNSELVQKVRLSKELSLLRINLETLLGMDLDEAIAKVKSSRK
jgi:outer membrane protein TolC